MRRNQSNIHEHRGLEESPREIVRHGHYGFWLSPDGRCFVVTKIYGHGPIASLIAEEYYGRHVPNAEVFLEEHGWARIGGLPNRFTLFTERIARGSYQILEQRQIDALFDLQVALPNSDVRRVIEQEIIESLDQMDMQMNPDEHIRTICAWCKTVMIDAPPGPRGEVTHGMCLACEKKFEEEELSFIESDPDYQIVKNALS